MKKQFAVLSIVIVFITGVIITLYPPPHASAVSGASWQAGRIIDDGIFTDPNSMSVSQVQDFLNAKVGTGGYGRIAGQCDTNGVGTSESGGGTRAQYGASRGNPAPFTCLKDYYEVPKTTPSPGIPASNYGGAAIPAGAKSAAELIWGAAQQYNISPKVLLVTIQKESAGPLTTDDWPFKSQYTYAMGAHCPDRREGASCEPNYAGFSIQIYESARLMRYYLDSMMQPWWTLKKPYQTNNILWQTIYDGSGNLTNCGGSNVYIQNKATAALYTYTPYQPNQAALNNMYGTGDYCSAYGNRNFWRIFTDWFGTTYSPYFTAQFRSQSASPYVMTGDSTNVYMQFINTSNTFWKDDASTFPGYPPIHLASTNPINRWSYFRSNDWLSGSRPNGTFTKVLEADGWNLAADQHTVQPGQIAEFQFKISVPFDAPGGVFREYFQPIAEGVTNFSLGAWANVDLYVVKSQYKASYHSQSSYPTLIGGENVERQYLQFKNDGNVPWYDDTSVPIGKYPVHLSTTWPINRGSSFSSGWPQSSRPAVNFNKVYLADGITLAPNQHITQPGQIARFEFDLGAPADTMSGFYREYFEPIVEGAPGNSWGMGTAAWIGINSQARVNTAQYSSQSSYPTLIAGGPSSVSSISLRNSGNTKWYDDISRPPGKFPVHLATDWPINRSSIFRNNWPAPSRPNVNFSKVYESDGFTLSQDQHIVTPGQIAHFEFNLQAPQGTAPGLYKEYFSPILEGAPGYTWNMNQSVWLGVTVN